AERVVDGAGHLRTVDTVEGALFEWEAAEAVGVGVRAAERVGHRRRPGTRGQLVAVHAAVVAVVGAGARSVGTRAGPHTYLGVAAPDRPGALVRLGQFVG